MKILLAELRAKIDRALLIEDTKSYKDLHSNSQEDVKNAGYLLKETNQLLSVAVSKNGEVTKESVEALLKAEKSTNIYIENLYKVLKDKPFVAGGDIPEEPECEDL